ncbi:hypothetical protein RHGRI_008531 [Rhododendron griersonianum]|uniref:KIB1-4 beta-propeller domain-containing protein n=1 Tax=Rhododendron griersonianum TaxID=479676 RepID=A0AAV6L1P9_9ERIC|nr:hypothetical protein RHGRI_008531 [Rhododendron griersonianum]
MVIILLNPFTGGAIPLPPLKDPHGPYEDFIDDGENFVKKVVLSSDPFLSPNNYEVVVIYEGMHRLAILESGKDSWNFVDRAPFVYSDVIYYPEGQGRGLYAVNYWRELVKIDLGSSTKKVLTKRTAYNAVSQYPNGPNGLVLSDPVQTPPAIIPDPTRPSNCQTQKDVRDCSFHRQQSRAEQPYRHNQNEEEEEEDESKP